MAGSKLMALSLLLLGAFHTVVSDVVVNEVIPGPGLPSLESLGLTSADLYNTTYTTALLPAISGRLDKRLTSACFPYSPQADYNDALACFAYLWNIASNQCGLTGTDESVINMCTAGNAIVSGTIWGIPIGSPPTHIWSYCADVAVAVAWSIDNCDVNNGIAGACAAYGNGNLDITVSGIH